MEQHCIVSVCVFHGATVEASCFLYETDGGDALASPCVQFTALRGALCWREISHTSESARSAIAELVTSGDYVRYAFRLGPNAKASIKRVTHRLAERLLMRVPSPIDTDLFFHCTHEVRFDDDVPGEERAWVIEALEQ